MEENVLELLLQKYQSFTKSEKKIVDYLLAHTEDAQYISITELGIACNVAVSTISVFCKKLNFDGFNSFKLSLAKATTYSINYNISSANQMKENDSINQIFEKVYTENHDALLNTSKLLKPDDVLHAVDLFVKANNIVILGQGNHSVVSTAAWSKFSNISSKFKTISDAHFHTVIISTLAPNDVLLYFSYSGATHEFIELAKLAKQRNIKIILVTRFANSPGTEFVDCVLLCGVNETPLSYGSIAAITSQLYIVDVLYNEFYHRNFEPSKQQLEYVASALSKRNLYLPHN